MVIMVIIVINESNRKINLGGRDLDVSVRVAPQEWDTRQPVFGPNCLARASELFRGHEARRAGKFGTGNLPTDRARGDFNLRIVAKALALS